MAYTGPFDRPIPGQSLTTEPKNSPWEQPPQMAELEEVARYYIDRIADDEVIDDMAAMCQSGVPLAPLVETIYMTGVAKGLHTIDAGLLVAPMIHSFLKAAITDMGVEVDDDGIDLQKQADEKEKQRFYALASAYLERNLSQADSNDPGMQMIQEMVEEGQEEASGKEEPNEVEGPEEEMQEEMTQEKPMGLMAKG